MKKFSDLLEGLLESTTFNDPPVMLVLRRKAIRTFPGGESIAQYRNDNLNIDVAIPYRPSTLGQVRKPVATATTEETHPKFSKVKVNKPDDEYHDQEGAVTGHFSKDPSKHFVQFSDVQGNKRVYKGHELTRLESIDEAMSPELKKIKKERTLFKRELARQEDRFDLSKQRLDWAKKALAGHIKKHGKVLKPMAEDTVNELSYETHRNYIDKAAVDQPKIYKDALGSKNLKNKQRLIRKWLNREKGIDTAKKRIHEDVVLESSIRSLWTIAKDRTPRTVRFRDGSTAMIDHPTAAQIMHLHSKVNRQNRHKIQSLINSGASGIKKISAFIKQHMKIQKGK